MPLPSLKNVFDENSRSESLGLIFSHCCKITPPFAPEPTLDGAKRDPKNQYRPLLRHGKLRAAMLRSS